MTRVGARWRRALERQWYGGGPWADVLIPFGTLFCAAGRWRRRYCHGSRGAIPSIVVGNLGVGGTAKTPASLAIVRYLQDRGWAPALVSRGYGAHPPQEPYAVQPGDSPDRAGDEPLLLRQLAPVYLGRRRLDAIAAAARDGHDVAVLDDGFQHLALAPHLRLLLLQGAHPFGNGRCLPAGPLREPAGAIAHADALLHDEAAGQTAWIADARQPAFSFAIRALSCTALGDGSQAWPLSRLGGARLHAMTGIARPERFQALLENLGAKVVLHAFPDHYRFRPEDLAAIPRPLVMTAKDAVKCQSFHDVRDCWVVNIGMEIETGFWNWMDGHLAAWRGYT